MGKDEKKMLQISSPFCLFFKVWILLLPFAMFIFPGTDTWVAAGLWFQCGVFCLFLISFLEKSKQFKPQENKALLILSFWIMLNTAMVFYDAAKSSFYHHLSIFAFINFLTFLIFYKVCVDHLTRDDIRSILKYVSIGVAVVCFYCVFQKFNLDQFQNPIGTEHMIAENPKKFQTDHLVGTIGNPTHLAAYLGLSLPLFYMRKNKTSFLIACLIWLIIAWTGSASGALTALVVTVFYGIFFKARSITPIVVGIVLYCVLFVMRGYDFKEFSGIYLNPQGRFEMWGNFIEVWKRRPILGYGLGYVRFLRMTDSSKTTWSHVHSELIQTGVELGALGVISVFYCIYHYFKTFFKTFKGEMSVALAAMFLGFLVNSLFNFPAHLWLLSSLGMMAYTFMYVVRNEEENSYV